MAEPFLIGDKMVGGYGKGANILQGCTIGVKRGYASSVVCHDKDFIGGPCDPVIVMAEGEALARGASDKFLNNEARIGTDLGRCLTNKAKAGVSMGQRMLSAALLACLGMGGTGPVLAEDNTCDQITEAVWFCYPAGSWQAMDDNQPMTVASYVSLMQVFAQFFVDGGGEAAGQTIDTVQQALMAEISTAMPGVDVPVVETVETTVDGVPALTIALAPTDGTQTAMITATIVVTAESTYRFATIAVADIYSENIRQMHTVFLNEIKFSNPNG